VSKQNPTNDSSHGWESIADEFIAVRNNNIGLAIVQEWATSLVQGASVLDIGCGFGGAYSKILISAGFNVYGIDASQTLINEFRKRFPETPVKCEAVESSHFFNKKFEGVIMIGLMFILSEQAQLKVLHKVGKSLHSGGRFLFTSPYQVCAWEDNFTKQISQSLGKETYVKELSKQGLSLVAEYTDEGKNHYFDFIKT